MRFQIRTNDQKKAAYESALLHIGNSWRAERDPGVRFMYKTVYEVMREVHQAAQ